MNSNERVTVANRVSAVTIIANVALTIIKVLVGILGNSTAMVADGIHSLSDVFTTVLALIGVKMSSKEDDEDHPYGHEKLEAVMSKLLAISLFITGVLIGYRAIVQLVEGDLQKPGQIAAFGAILSIVVKEWMFRYTHKAAIKIDSQVLMGDAYHHRSDAYSSIATLIGVVGAILGYLYLEPIASIVISGLIVKIAVEIFMQSVNDLVDRAADHQTEMEIKVVIENVEGVKGIDLLKTRRHGNVIYVDVEIAVQGDLSLVDAHEIAETVHDQVELKIPKAKHCMVHVNPYTGASS